MATNHQSAKLTGGVLYVPPEDAKRRVGTVPSKGAQKALRKYELLNEQPPYTFTYKEVLEQVAEPGNKTASYRIMRSELVKEWGWAIHQNASGKIALIDCGTEEYKKLQEDSSVQKKSVSRISRNKEANGSSVVIEEKSAYLLTWNPDNWNDWNLSHIAQDVKNGHPHKEPWRCCTKSTQPGDLVFVLKQGSHQPLGLIGSGITVSHFYQKPYNEKDGATGNALTRYVDVELDYLVNGMQEVVIKRSELDEMFPRQYWRAQSSGTRIKPETLLPLIELWENRTGHSLLLKSEEEFAEGRELYRLHRTRERNQQLVKQAKEQRLREKCVLECDVCGFNFFDIYGAMGKGYIECHHTKPVSELQPDEKTSLKDIALVCANCHRMLHRKRPWLSMSQLRSLIQPSG